MPTWDLRDSQVAASCPNRRQFLRQLGGGSSALLGAAYGLAGGKGALAGAQSDQQAFSTRGYYIILSRMPTFGLAEWKQILRYMKEDSCNFLILWMGGGFRSKKFPITWQYNRDHKNIAKDFVRELIDFGHSLGIKIVLGFTPFSYDGVNQYPLEHPEVKGFEKDGTLAKLAGIHCWGYALNPSEPEAQRFMLEYASELYFDFYPNADGLFIESSDYAICYCPRCSGHYYEREFEFVKAISDRVWQKAPNATIVVYPHYFSGAEIPEFGRAVQEKYDPRWTLFFTPHSAPILKDIVRQAPNSIYWEPVPLFTPEEIQKGCRQARDAGINGRVVSLECYTFRARYPEFGFWQLIGTRQKAFGYLWLEDNVDPYGYPLTRVWRIACREFSRDPDLSPIAFRAVLKKEIFAEATTASAVDDLLAWQKAYVTDRSWTTPGPTVSPTLLDWQLELGRVKPAQLETYRAMLERLKEIRNKYPSSHPDSTVREMLRGVEWILAQWGGKENTLKVHYTSS